MFVETQGLINQLYKADDSYYSVIVSGSGTSANECVLSSALKDNEKVLLIKNGVFGERLQQIVNKHKIPFEKVEYPWGTYPDLDEIEKAIAAHDDVRLVAMVCNESSTGMLNPVKSVGALCKKYGKRFFIDTVSAAGGEYIDIKDFNVDIATSVGGKCLGAYPGSAYVIAKKDFLDSLSEEQCKTVYLNLYNHYHMAMEMHQTPNTPNVTLFWALNQALKNVMDIGVDNYIAYHAGLAQTIRTGIKEMNMEFLLPEEYMSNTITSIMLPRGIGLSEFIDKMEQFGYTNYKGKGKYEAMNMFQVGNMGAITQEDCRNYLSTLKTVLAGFGYEC